MADNDLQILTGLKIKNYRNKSGYTQEQLCNMLNIDISGLSKIENGRNFPSFDTLCKLFTLLQINPSEFFDFICIKNNSADISEIMLIEQVKTLNSKDRNKVVNFIKMLKE